MEDQRNTLSVVKIGGGVIEDPEALKYFARLLVKYLVLKYSFMEGVNLPLP